MPTLEAVATVELGDGGCTPALKRGERLSASPPGDEPPSPVVQLRRFQLLEQLHSSGDTTIIDRDRLKTPHTHTHLELGQLVACHCEDQQIPPVGGL